VTMSQALMLARRRGRQRAARARVRTVLIMKNS
jgi:hypothetical protein